MRHSTDTVIAFCLSAALISLQACVQPADPNKNAGWSSGGSRIGGARSPGAESGAAIRRTTIKGGTVDPDRSRELTQYLKGQGLPLVGAQVLADSGSNPRVILFGFVGSTYSKLQAERKTRDFIGNLRVAIDDRIKIRSELAATESAARPPSAGSFGSAQSYQRQQLQNQYSYQQRGPSLLTTLIPLLGLFGAVGSGGLGLGSYGGFGTGYGGFGSSYGGFGSSYGYPPYTSPLSPGGLGYPYTRFRTHP